MLMTRTYADFTDFVFYAQSARKVISGRPQPRDTDPVIMMTIRAMIIILIKVIII